MAIKTFLELAKEKVALFNKLKEYSGGDRIISSEDMADIVKGMGEVSRIEFGYPTLDELLGEDKIPEGSLVVITGATSDGKTSFCQSITKNFSRDKVKSIWFSYEMTARQFINKMYVKDQVCPFYVPMENTSSDIQWIKERMCEAMVKYDCKVAFIDHINHIYDITQSSGKNSSLEISSLVTQLKDFCKEYGYTIFLIAHSRDPQIGRWYITKEDIRDSGMISRLSDVVISVRRTPNDFNPNSKEAQKNWRPLEKGDTRTVVRLDKNRNGGRQGYAIFNYSNNYHEEVDELFII